MSMLDEALSACYHDTFSDSENESAGVFEATPSHHLELGAVEALEAMHSELSSPAAAPAEISPRIAAAIESGARISVSVVGEETSLAVDETQEASVRTPQQTLPVVSEVTPVDYGELISPTVANFLGDDAGWQKANADLLKQVSDLREQVSHLQIARAGMSKAHAEKSKAYAELQMAFDRLSADRLALFREDRLKQQRIDNLVKVIQTITTEWIL